MEKYCNCPKELFIFFDQTHQHLKEKSFLDGFMIDGSLNSELHCNICDKPLINEKTRWKRDNVYR